MRSSTLGTGKDDLIVLDNTADGHNCRSVRRRSGVLHQNSRVVGALEVAKVPLGRGVVRLHALESVDEHGASLAIDRTIRSGDRALSNTPGPENVAHGTPRIGMVGAEQCCARGANLEARRRPLDGHVDDRSFIVQRLDCVRVSIFRKLDGAIGGVEAGLVLAELVVFEGRRAPEVGLGSIQGEDLGVELASCADATVASPDQHESQVSMCARLTTGGATAKLTQR